MSLAPFLHITPFVFSKLYLTTFDSEHRYIHTYVYFFLRILHAYEIRVGRDCLSLNVIFFLMLFIYILVIKNRYHCMSCSKHNFSCSFFSFPPPSVKKNIFYVNKSVWTLHRKNQIFFYLQSWMQGVISRMGNNVTRYKYRRSLFLEKMCDSLVIVAADNKPIYQGSGWILFDENFCKTFLILMMIFDQNRLAIIFTPFF